MKYLDEITNWKSPEIIKEWRELTNPNVVAVHLTDFHIGAANALFPPEWIDINGNKVLASPKQLEIYEKYLEAVEIIRAWNPDIGFFTGDMIDGNRSPFRKVLTLPNDQGYLCAELLRPIVKDLKKTYWVASTPYHDGWDVKYHRMIASLLGRAGDAFVQPDASALITDVCGVKILVTHKILNLAQYLQGVAEKEAIFMAAHNSSSDGPIDMILGGHFHRSVIEERFNVNF